LFQNNKKIANTQFFTFLKISGFRICSIDDLGDQPIARNYIKSFPNKVGTFKGPIIRILEMAIVTGFVKCRKSCVI